jgi:hypothetical protein
MKVDFKSMLLKRVDLKGLLLEDFLMTVVKAGLEDIVKKSDNKFDDAALTFVWPQLEEACRKFVDEKYEEISK